jgi:hypothetical protein
VAPTPAPTATPGPGLPAQVSCSTALSTLITNAAAGSTLNLGTCVYTSHTSITKAIRLYGGTYRLPLGATAISVNANDVTIESAKFEGGGWTVKVFGVDRTKILNSRFTGMSETSIRLEGPSVDGMLIEGNTIIQSVVTGQGYSSVSGLGYGRGMNNNLVVRNNFFDNGPSNVAWFGLEVWDNVGLVIEGNTFRGAGALISIPRSDGALIQSNTFDMTTAFWGMELADVDNAQVLNNTAFANGSIDMNTTWRALVQLHPGSGTVQNIRISGNKLTNYPALVNAAGSGHTVTNNCMNSVGRLNWGSWAGPVTISGNASC